MTTMNDRRILRDYADRRKKLGKHDDGRESVLQLMKGLIVVIVSVFILWIAFKF